MDYCKCRLLYVSTEQRKCEKEKIVLETDEDDEDDKIKTDFEIDFENLYIIETSEPETPSEHQQNYENRNELTTSATASTPNATKPTN